MCFYFSFQLERTWESWLHTLAREKVKKGFLNELGFFSFSLITRVSIRWRLEGNGVGVEGGYLFSLT